MIPEACRYFRWGTQKRKLYDRLACGPVTAAEIVRDLRIYNYHQVIFGVRRALFGTGVTVKGSPINGKKNHWEFRLGTVNPS